MFKFTFKPTLLLLLTVFLNINISSISTAQIQCQNLFNDYSKQKLPQLLQKLSGLPVPIGEVSISLKSGNTKRLPVILVNAKSLESISPIYEQSIGMVVAHQKGHSNDHGLLRLGKYFIDRDVPGIRSRGEINNTGISWSPVKDFVDYATKKLTSNRIEVMFELSATEYNTSLLYQKMRRGAMIRPDFTFGQDKNNPEWNNVIKTGENCFTFCTGSGVAQQINAIKEKINSITHQPTDVLMVNLEVAKYTEIIKSNLLKIDLSASHLNPDLVLLGEIPNIVKNLNLSRTLEVELLNWIVGLKISQDYYELLQTLNIKNSSSFSNVESNRATAVLIYDAKVNPQTFLSAQYTSNGIFSTWKNNEFVEIQSGDKSNNPSLITKLNIIQFFKNLF